MGSIAVLASGSGSNFQAIAESFAAAGKHRVSVLVYDRREAYAARRAENLGIPSHYVRYPGRSREEAEKEIISVLEGYRPDLVILAGFMRLFTPVFVNAFPGRIVNIHPSLLPKHAGSHGIKDSFESGDKILGLTIHYLDEGMDTGPVIVQESFERNGRESLEEIEKKIHNLEHTVYPRVISDLLDKLRDQREGV